MILERLEADIKAAMRSKDKDRLKVLRTLKSAVKQVEIDTRSELSEDDVIGILKGEHKKRLQAKELYESGERKELAAVEQFEIELIEEYLPKALTEGELTAAVEKAIIELSAEGIQDMGKVMKQLKEELGNRADGKQLSIIVRQKLSK
jgi:uncharacterized protein YqeY